MEEKLRIDKRRKGIIILIIVTLLIQVILIGAVAESLFKMEAVGYDSEARLSDMRDGSLRESLRIQTSKLRTIRDTWRSMYGFVGEIDAGELYVFLNSVVSSVEGVDPKESIMVIDRESGIIILPYDYQGMHVESYTQDPVLVNRILSSSDIVYPNYFIFKDWDVEDHSDYYGFGETHFGDGERIFYNKVTVPRPRTDGKEYIVMSGFREDRVMSTYKKCVYGLEEGIRSLVSTNRVNLIYIIGNMILVIVHGFILVLSLRFVVGDMDSWERKNGC